MKTAFRPFKPGEAVKLTGIVPREQWCTDYVLSLEGNDEVDERKQRASLYRLAAHVEEVLGENGDHFAQVVLESEPCLAVRVELESAKHAAKVEPLLHEAARRAGLLEPAAKGETRTVTIPAMDEHAGLHSITVELPWVCLVCGGPRGEPFEALSFDGSRRLSCHAWRNPCGHSEPYGKVRLAYGQRAAQKVEAAIEKWEGTT